MRGKTFQLKVAGPSSVTDVGNFTTEQSCHFLQCSYGKSRGMLKTCLSAAQSILGSIEVAELESTPGFCLWQRPVLGASDTAANKSRGISCSMGFTGQCLKNACQL